MVSAVLLFSCTNTTTTKISEENFETKPHDFMFAQRAYPTGQLKTDAYRKAVQWKKEQPQKASNGLLWEFVGPVNVGGRITDIEIPVDDGATFYVGAASGGIFKTTDAGATWLPIFDGQEMLSIGDIELSKSNTDIVWVGTGEVNAGGGSLAYDGDGMYRSTDGGLTWESKGLPDVGSVGKVLIDPSNNDVVYAGVMGPLFRKDNNRGVYKTTNGGATWEQKLFVSDSTGIVDMAMHPSNGNLLYAASWERIRRPAARQYGGETSGLWRSNDGGDTWDEMTNGLPSDPLQKGRISIDISQSNPDVLFARYADANGSIQGVYRTDDGGDTWTERNSSQLNNVGFHWWFRGIYIDPSDEDTLYNVDFEVQKSTDGGMNWSIAFPNVHVDQHALAFNIMVPGGVLLGNDGGLYLSTNDGATSVKDVTLPITQFYRFHVDAQNDDKIYGGAQDNSTIRTVSGSDDDWDVIFGGDGFQPLVDPENTNVIYALSQYGNLGKSTNNGLNFGNATSGIPNGARRNWDTPIVFDPSNSQTLYYGANRVYKTTNAAGSWTAISPDLTGGPYTGNLVYGTITSISVSPFSSDLIYVGTDDGNVWITDDGGDNWDIISTSLPNRWVTSVLASRDDENTVYVTYSGYRYGEDSGHVYRSLNRGSFWYDISGGLPDIPVNDIVRDDEGNLYVATDVGVFGSGTEGSIWEVVGSNLPSVVVNDMHIHEASQFLYIGTYGRSSYKIDLSGVALGVSEETINTAVQLAPNPASDYIEITWPKSFLVRAITIYDVLGKTIVEASALEIKNGHLDIAHVRAGHYYVEITDGTKRITKKLLKK